MGHESLESANSLLLGIVGSALFVLCAWLVMRRRWRNVVSERPPLAATAAARDQPPASALPVPPEAASANDDLVPITHPLIRRAAEAAVRKGGPTARAIVQQGDQLFFSFAHIADPAERQAAYDLLRQIEGDGADIDLAEALRLVRRLFAA